MLQPAAAPASSALEAVVLTLPSEPCTTTKYCVPALSVMPEGAVNRRSPAASVVGLVRVATVVPALVVDTPVASCTVSPDDGLRKFSTTASRT